MNRFRCAALVAATLAAATAFAAPPSRGRLPLVTFTAAQGLPSDSVNTLYADSHGYLWFGTDDGLARFDGAHFVVYGRERGLPSAEIDSIVEDGAGSLWFGTTEGAVRLDPNSTNGQHPFIRPAGTPPTDVLFVSRSGALWASCGDGDLCAVQGGRSSIDPTFHRAGGKQVLSIAEDAQGGLWVGTEQGVMHRPPGGAWRHYDVHPEQGIDRIWSLHIDDAGRIWISHSLGIVILGPEADDADRRSLADRAAWTLIPGVLHLPQRGEIVAIRIPRVPMEQPDTLRCRAFFRARDKTLWGATDAGLLHVDHERVELLDSRDDLPQAEVTSVAQDSAGNLWFATRGAGAVRISRDGAVTYTRADGLADDRITSIVQLDDGTVCVTDTRRLSCFEGGALHGVALRPSGVRYFGWGWNQIVVRDRVGEWWVASGEGLIRWPAVRNIEELAQRTPIAIYKGRDGISGDDVFRVWQDSRGNLWLATFGDEPLARRNAVTGRFSTFGPRNGFPKITPTGFAEDRAGNIWMGLYTGGLVRYADGRFDRFNAGLPQGLVTDLKVDGAGALWMTTRFGVARIDDPAARQISIRRFAGHSLAYCIAPLADGRVAIGTERGVDLFDPAGRGEAHLTTNEGLASNEIYMATCDRNGTLWLGTLRGLSALRALPRIQPAAPPQPRIVGLEIAGKPVPVAELGTAALPGVRLRDPQRGMTVTFAAPYFDVAHPLRFEYRFASDARWTNGETRGVVAYERLPFGRGTFEVRSVATDGRRSPASRLDFEVLPPFWMRWWFVAAVALAVVLTALGLHRLRVEHLLALQRVRARLATDLHDDLGSSLSRISILSEVAKSPGHQNDRERFLTEIGETARTLIDALGDTVWSIDPRRDNLQSVLARARHFAADMLDAKSIALDVIAPPDAAACRIDPQRRRELYLILKEALNNTARHAGARRVVVTAAVEDHRLRLEIADDGRGFVPDAAAERENGGRGIASMSERARRAGGNLSIVSRVGEGTRLTVAVPL